MKNDNKVFCLIIEGELWYLCTPEKRALFLGKQVGKVNEFASMGLEMSRKQKLLSECMFRIKKD